MAVKDSSKSSKVKIEDLDLEYFRFTVEEQLSNAFSWAGILEVDIKKNGDFMLIMPQLEVRIAFISLSKGDA